MAAADCAVIAIDRDPGTKAHADKLGGGEHPGRFALFGGLFRRYARFADRAGFAGVDGVTLDLGVSSMQLDEAERGFSFMRDGPLDMRMSQDGDSAADLLNEGAAELLSDIIAVYGEERRARAIAKAIIARGVKAFRPYQ